MLPSEFIELKPTLSPSNLQMSRWPTATPEWSGEAPGADVPTYVLTSLETQQIAAGKSDVERLTGGHVLDVLNTSRTVFDPARGEAPCADALVQARALAQPMTTIGWRVSGESVGAQNEVATAIAQFRTPRDAYEYLGDLVAGFGQCNIARAARTLDGPHHVAIFSWSEPNKRRDLVVMQVANVVLELGMSSDWRGHARTAERLAKIVIANWSRVLVARDQARSFSVPRSPVASQPSSLPVSPSRSPEPVERQVSEAASPPPPPPG